MEISFLDISGSSKTFLEDLKEELQKSSESKIVGQANFILEKEDFHLAVST